MKIKITRREIITTEVVIDTQMYKAGNDPFKVAVLINQMKAAGYYLDEMFEDESKNETFSQERELQKLEIKEDKRNE